METRTVKLGDLSSDLKGQYGINASAVPLRTTLPTYLRITDIDDFGRIKHDGLCSVETDELNKYSLREGDLVFARTGNSTGRNYWYDSHDGSFVFAGFLIRFHFEETEELVPRFLKYYVQSTEYYDWIEGFSTGSTRKNLNARDYGNLPVVLPPKAYQQKVVAILDMIENKILLNQQINKNLQKLKDDIWISQRVDKKTSLSNLMTIQSGKRPIDRYDNKFRLKELYPIIGANGVMGWTSKALTAGTIITTGRVGTHGVVNMFDEPVWVSDNSFVISSKYEEVAYEILRCDVKFLTLVHGTTQPLITQKDLKQYVVSIPSNNQLKKVNEHLKVYTNLINVNNKQNKFLTALRNLLLPKLLSGEIDLSDVKEVIQGD